MSKTELSRMKPPLVPLATLIGRELRNEKVEKPFVKYGQAGLAKKGEDYFLIKTDCQRIPGDSSTLFSVFAVLVDPLGLPVYFLKLSTSVSFLSSPGDQVDVQFLPTFVSDIYYELLFGRSLMGIMVYQLLYLQRKIYLVML